MTAAWQRTNCPPGLDLRPFEAGEGQVIEATIMDLGGERLYVPSVWLRRPGVALYQSPAPAGVRAMTGGSGGLDPQPAGGEFPGVYGHDNCLGISHRARFERVDRLDPDFFLTLHFHPGFTASAREAGPLARGEWPAGGQVLRLNFMEHGDPDRMWDGSPALVFPLRPGPTVIRSGEGNRRLTAVELPDGWFLSFPINRQIAMQFRVSGSIDRTRWPEIVQRARTIYAWLKTPPAARDNGGVMRFLTPDPPRPQR